MSGLPILTFHSIDDSGSPISLSRRRLERVVGELAAAGWHGCSLRDGIEAWRSGASDRRLGLSFDDGYRNVLENGLPVLREAGFRATVFVVAGRCGGDNRWPGQAPWAPRMPLLDTEGLGRLQEEGWEIGSHGMSHRPLLGLAGDALDEELEGSRQRLERWLGRPVTSFAYPYGIHDAEVRRRTGRVYEWAFGTRLAIATAADLDDPVAIPRVDAYYLRRAPAHRILGSRAGRAYLALRRWARKLRPAPVDAAGVESAGS